MRSWGANPSTSQVLAQEAVSGDKEDADPIGTTTHCRWERVMEEVRP